MTEQPPSEAAHSDPPLEGRDAAEARMAPPHLVLLNGVAKETSRAHKLMSIESVMPSNSHPLLSPSPITFSPSQNQDLFQ